MTNRENLIKFAQTVRNLFSKFVSNVNEKFEKTKEDYKAADLNLKEYIDSKISTVTDRLVPIGTIIGVLNYALDYQGGGEWKSCNGQTLASKDYPDLYKRIGTKYGGNSTNFKLPDLRNGYYLRGCGTNKRTNSVGKTISIGDVESQALPNVSGTFYTFSRMGISDMKSWMTGPFSFTNDTKGAGIKGGGWDDDWVKKVKFNLSNDSNVYKDSEEVRPLSLNVEWYIRVL